MKQDKAIFKALKSQQITKLPEDFNERIMQKVYIASAKQKKYKTILTYVLIAFVSLVLISLAVFLLKDYITLNTLIPKFTFSTKSKSILGFSAYIAFLVLILVFLDDYFRNLREKRLNKKSQ